MSRAGLIEEALECSTVGNSLGTKLLYEWIKEGESLEEVFGLVVGKLLGAVEDILECSSDGS